MIAKRTMGIIVLTIIGIIVAFIFVLYATIKTKSTNLKKYEPFKEWVGKTVLLNKETVLFNESLGSIDNSNYPYALLDSSHPQWQYVEERKHMAKPELEEVVRFPAGTMLKLEQAIQYTNGVSGFSYPAIFGTITPNSKKYKASYQWGKINLGKRYDKIEKCWQFHQAPWQDRLDTAFYALPTSATAPPLLFIL